MNKIATATKPAQAIVKLPPLAKTPRTIALAKLMYTISLQATQKAA